MLCPVASCNNMLWDSHTQKSTDDTQRLKKKNNATMRLKLLESTSVVPKKQAADNYSAAMRTSLRTKGNTKPFLMLP